MKTRKILTLACVALAAASCGTADKQEQAAAEQRVEQVKTQPVEKREITRQLEISTTLQGYETMNIAPSLTGKIEHIYVEVGDKVKKGDMLVRMDQNQYNTTKLTFANLGVELARMDALKETGSISQQTYDQTKLSYDQTKESIDFLATNTFVKAQFPGVISAKNYEDGELYGGQAILTLTQIDQLKALIAIPEQYYRNVKEGKKVILRSEIYPEQTFESTIEVVYPTIDPATHTFQAKLRIPNKKEQLRPGMFVRTTLEVGKADALIVPYQAVLKLVGSNDRYVFINENGTAKRVGVTLGQRFDQLTEIFSNEISEGDELVTVGQAKLVNGTKLNVVE